jgi:TP901-1 family phage major tail protein
MGKILGKDYRLFIKVSSTTEPLAGETSSNLNLSADVIEVSGKNSAWKEYLAGMKGGTVDATVYADSADVVQGAVLSALMAGTEVECFYGKVDDEEGFESGYRFNAIVTSLGESADIGGALSRSISLQVTGAIERI